VKSVEGFFEGAPDGVAFAKRVVLDPFAMLRGKVAHGREVQDELLGMIAGMTSEIAILDLHDVTIRQCRNVVEKLVAQYEADRGHRRFYVGNESSLSRATGLAGQHQG